MLDPKLSKNCSDVLWNCHLRIARPRTSQRSVFVFPPSAPVTTGTIRFAIARSATTIDTTKVAARTTCITQHCRTYRRWTRRRRPTWSRRLSGEPCPHFQILVPYLLRYPVSLNVRKISGQGWGTMVGTRDTNSRCNLHEFNGTLSRLGRRDSVRVKSYWLVQYCRNFRHDSFTSPLSTGIATNTWDLESVFTCRGQINFVDSWKVNSWEGGGRNDFYVKL